MASNIPFFLNPNPTAQQTEAQADQTLGPLRKMMQFTQQPAAQPKRNQSLGKKAVARKQATKAPVGKEGKSLEQSADEVANEAVSGLNAADTSPYGETTDRFAGFLNRLKQIDPRQQQAAGKFNVLESILPTPDEFGIAAEQGMGLYDILSDNPTTQAQNEELLKMARENYDKKAANPYRNVDLESIDRLTASTFGGQQQGLKNVAEPVNEFNILAGALSRLQGAKGARAKEIMDYIQTMLKPVQTGVISAETAKIPAPKAPRSTASQDRMTDKDVIAAYAKLDEKNGPILQKFDQVTGNLRAGDMTSLKTSLPILAKTIGSDVGNIALQEADRYMPSNLKMTFANLLSYMESDPNYPVPKEVSKAVAAYVSRARQDFLKRVDSERSRIYKSFEASPSYRDANSRVYGNIGTDLETKYAPKKEAPKAGKSFSEWKKSKGK